MTQKSLFWLATVPVALALGCSSGDNPGPAGSGGNAGVGGSDATGGRASSVTSTGVSTGGAVNTGGSPGTGGAMEATGGANHTGGKAATGGANPVGGSVATGGSTGAPPATGGRTATGGGAAGGSGDTGGKAAGGAATGGAGMATGGKAAGGAATGGTTSSSGCQKGVIKPGEVVFMGESFYAIAPQYNQTRVEADARTAGSLATGAKYRNVAVSGQTMNYVLVTEWPAATQGGAVKVVIMDGGGIDCMTSSCSTCPGDFTTLLGKMATAGVQDVIYTRYPEPGAPPGSNATLKGNLDILMPKMQAVCAATTSPRCHWLDLRPVWVTGDTTDGLHPTQSGGNHVGDAIWGEMVKDCIAQ